MSWHEFIFSENKTTRYIRHIVFWIVWGLYFYSSRYFYPKPFLSGQTKSIPDGVEILTISTMKLQVSAKAWTTIELIRSLLFLSVHIIACYIVLYVLLRYLLKARYFYFLSGIALLVLVMIILCRFVDTNLMPAFVEKSYNMPYYNSIFSGMVSAVKIIFVAVAIKLAKHWWFKQKEKERLEKEKIDAELQLLKAQIHPQFLFSTLNNIYSFALTASPKAPEMLLKLSDILSYMLYECNEALVPLKKEIKVLGDYMALEKMRYGKKMEINIHVKGNTNDYKIAPLLLIRLIENSFKQSDSNAIEQPWINLEMHVENCVLEMKLMNGKSLASPVKKDSEEDDLALAERRLQLLYPGKHVLKITEEPDIMIISLQLQLNEPAESNKTLQKETAEAGILRMAGAV